MQNVYCKTFTAELHNKLEVQSLTNMLDLSLVSDSKNHPVTFSSFFLFFFSFFKAGLDHCVLDHFSKPVV